MFTIDDFITLVGRKIRPIMFTVAIIVIVALLVPFALSFTPENVTKREIKDKIVQKIGRDDFEVKQIVARSGDWYLAKIGMSKNYDNTSLAILKKENGRFVLKFGPGTSFNEKQLEAAGVPLAIYDPRGSVSIDPIVKLLPYQTNDFIVKIAPPASVKFSTSDANPDDDTIIGTPENKKELTVYMYEFPRMGIKATPQRIAQAKNNILAWMQLQNLDPDNYTLTFALWNSGKY